MKSWLIDSEHLDLHQGSREAAALQAGGFAALPYSVVFSLKTDSNRQPTAFKAVASASCATQGNWSERKVLPPLPLASKASALLDELRPDMAVPRRFELPFSALTTQRPGR